ncbi:MAG: VWA domain-containing protein, partial [Thermoanaerobaculia bacterium]
MRFATPDWLWLLLAAPAAAAVAGWCWRRRLRAVAEWASRSLWDRLLPTHDPRRLVTFCVLLMVAVLAVALALARPRWGTSEQQVERQGVDVVFVLDTSLSMATRDVVPSRIWVAQTLIRRLVQELPGNRMALVQAEGDGVVMVPLTSDAAVIDLLLDAVLPGSLPTPGTELAPALEDAAELFPEDGGKHKVMILLSDGEDHGTGLEKVADQLHDAGVVVHAVGVGTREGKPLELPPTADAPPAAGPRAAGSVEYKRDEAGNVVVSRLMEDNLEKLSRETGGIYLRASSAGVELGRLTSAIDAMEKRSYGAEVVNTLEERFQWPLMLAILALSLQLLISPFRRPQQDPLPQGERAPPPARDGPPPGRTAARSSVAAVLASMVLTAAPASAEWPAWVEKLLFNSAERTERGAESFAEGEPASAVDPLETALRLRGEEPVAQYNAGTARLAAERGDAASLLESAATAGNPRLASRASYNLGNARMAADDLPGSIEAFKDALRRDSAMDDAKFNLELAQRLLEEQQQQQENQDGPPQEDEQQQDQQQEQDSEQQDPQDSEQDQQDSEQDQQDQQDQDQQEQEQQQ